MSEQPDGSQTEDQAVSGGQSEICEEACSGVCGQPCEVYSRVVGYMRPVKQWNPGKQAEYAKRREFRAPDWSDPAEVERINRAVEARFGAF